MKMSRLGLFLLLICLPFASVHADELKVRVALMSQECKPDNIPYFIAKKKSFFSDENLSVSEDYFNPDERVSADKIFARFDVIVAGRARIYFMEAKTPGKIKAFAANVISDENPDYKIVTLKSHSGTKIEDFVGQKFGVDHFSGRARLELIDVILDHTGLKSNQFKVVAADAEDLKAGRVDLFYLREPNLAVLEKTVELKTIIDSPVTKYIMSPWPMGFAAVSTGFETKHPTATDRLSRVWDRSIDYMRDHPQEVKDFEAECNSSNYKVSTAGRPYAYWKWSEILKDKIQKQMDLYHTKKIIPRQIHPDDLIWAGAKPVPAGIR